MEIDRRGVHRGHRASGCRPAADKTAPGAVANQEPVITLELPHPALLVDRLTDPRIQQSLKLLPQYRKFLEGQQFRELQAVVTMVSSQLQTTWDRALPRPRRRGAGGAGLRRTGRRSAHPGRVDGPGTEDPGSGQRDLPEHGPPGRQEQEEARTGAHDRLQGYGHTQVGWRRREGTGLRDRLRQAGDRDIDEGSGANRGSTARG